MNLNLITYSVDELMMCYISRYMTLAPGTFKYLYNKHSSTLNVHTEHQNTILSRLQSHC